MSKLKRYDLEVYARFWSKVNVLKKNQCWEWRSSKNKSNYGQLSISNKPSLAHRLSYEFFNGSIPEGMWIDHICMNRSCVNPKHLRSVTPQVSCTENTTGSAAINKTKVYCKNGHKFTLSNTIIKTYKDRPNARACKTCRDLTNAARGKTARQALSKIGITQ